MSLNNSQPHDDDSKTVSSLSTSLSNSGDKRKALPSPRSPKKLILTTESANAAGVQYTAERIPRRGKRGPPTDQPYIAYGNDGYVTTYKPTDISTTVSPEKVQSPQRSTHTEQTIFPMPSPSKLENARSQAAHDDACGDDATVSSTSPQANFNMTKAKQSKNIIDFCFQSSDAESSDAEPIKNKGVAYADEGSTPSPSKLNYARSKATRGDDSSDDSCSSPKLHFGKVLAKKSNVKDLMFQSSDDEEQIEKEGNADADDDSTFVLSTTSNKVQSQQQCDNDEHLEGQEEEEIQLHDDHVNNEHQSTTIDSNNTPSKNRRRRPTLPPLDEINISVARAHSPAPLELEKMESDAHERKEVLAHLGCTPKRIQIPEVYKKNQSMQHPNLRKHVKKQTDVGSLRTGFKLLASRQSTEIKANEVMFDNELRFGPICCESLKELKFNNPSLRLAIYSILHSNFDDADGKYMCVINLYCCGIYISYSLYVISSIGKGFGRKEEEANNLFVNLHETYLHNETYKTYLLFAKMDIRTYMVTHHMNSFDEKLYQTRDVIEGMSINQCKLQAYFPVSVMVVEENFYIDPTNNSNRCDDNSDEHCTTSQGTRYAYKSKGKESRAGSLYGKSKLNPEEQQVIANRSICIKDDKCAIIRLIATKRHLHKNGYGSAIVAKYLDYCRNQFDYVYAITRLNYDLFCLRNTAYHDHNLKPLTSEMDDYYSDYRQPPSWNDYDRVMSLRHDLTLTGLSDDESIVDNNPEDDHGATRKSCAKLMSKFGFNSKCPYNDAYTCDDDDSLQLGYRGNVMVLKMDHNKIHSKLASKLHWKVDSNDMRNIKTYHDVSLFPFVTLSNMHMENLRYIKINAKYNPEADEDMSFDDFYDNGYFETYNHMWHWTIVKRETLEEDKSCYNVAKGAVVTGM